MDNPHPTQSEPGEENNPDKEFEQPSETQPEVRPESMAEEGLESLPEIKSGFEAETPPMPEIEPGKYVNEKIRQSFERVKSGYGQAKDYYQRSPHLQKVAYQGKFLPAFWTVACIFSLVVNIILIALLVSFGHHFFELKSLVSEGLVGGLSENLALMDKAHIVYPVPVTTTVQLKDNLPVAFDLPIKQGTEVLLAQDTTIDGTTYINLAPVPLNITLPEGTPIKVNFDMTIPVSQSVPVDVAVPVSMQVPLDLAIDQTDLHQAIVGLQNTIEPYKSLLDTTFNSPADISLCKHWWSGWLCSIFFGKP